MVLNQLCVNTGTPDDAEIERLDSLTEENQGEKDSFYWTR